MRLKLLLSILCISSLAMAEQIIRVSQIGYLPEAKKFAIIMTGDSGRWEYTRYDFSELKEEGWHQLKIGEAAIINSALSSLDCHFNQIHCIFSSKIY